ncbi:Sapep family Mn(2+)-dependent dipeptidase [Butyrivibrio sp. FC2001]|uniref:Sapep family Mn(2+)-dependent dipeptidase n=1 Tax=Butyrivibrio sp. FC2001 TaxID=1280671 RepID=UPI000406FCE8|nr:Sapep family Mn(2+)-dependent dipeptidase [Butyrivibrio sp. FC2001]
MNDKISLSVSQSEFLSKIIAIPSVGGLPEEGAPYGVEPRRVLQTFLDEAEEKGFRTGIEGERVGWAEFGEGEDLIGIICHLDVVPVGDGWDSDPFTLTIRTDETGQEALYARGIVDDKGPACAAFFAMVELAEENRIPQNYRVRLILGTDEERGCSCIQYYAKHAEIPAFSITPDSIFPVIYCEKGIIQLKVFGKNTHNLKACGGSAVNIVPASALCDINGKTITAKGKAAHASKPYLGENAIELLVKKMEEQGVDISDYPVIKFVRDFDVSNYTGCTISGDYGDLTYNIGMLKAGEKGCELWMDFRIPYDANQESFIDKLTKKASEYGLETDVTINMPPLLKDKESPEVRMLSEIWKRHIDKFTEFKNEYLNMHTEPRTVGVGTYARHIPNTIAFGIQAPWKTDQCHQANEHVATADYLQWIQIIREYILEVGRYIVR